MKREEVGDVYSGINKNEAEKEGGICAGVIEKVRAREKM